MANTDNSNKEPIFKDSNSEFENTEFSTTNIQVDSDNKIAENVGMGIKPKLVKSRLIKGPVATITKQSMRYITVKNIESDTGYLQIDWSIFVLKELLDNAYDWLNDLYPANSPKYKEMRKVVVRIWITSDSNKNKFVHIAVRNSNPNNEPAFLNLNKIFDFDNWYSTKRNQHRMTCGSHGDALKRCLGMGYASWTSDYDPDESIEDKQWNEPIIVRRNRFEFRVFIKVNVSRENIWPKIQQEKRPRSDIGLDTEVEVTLPVILEYSQSSETGNWYARLLRYFQIYRIGKPRTGFEIYYSPEEEDN